MTTSNYLSKSNQGCTGIYPGLHSIHPEAAASDTESDLDYLDAYTG